MNKELEHSFVELLEKHQNIIHKVCRLYTNNYDAHNDLFQEIKANKSIYLKEFRLVDWNFDGYKDISVLNEVDD